MYVQSRAKCIEIYRSYTETSVSNCETIPDFCTLSTQKSKGPHRFMKIQTLKRCTRDIYVLPEDEPAEGLCPSAFFPAEIIWSKAVQFCQEKKSKTKNQAQKKRRKIPVRSGLRELIEDVPKNHDLSRKKRHGIWPGNTLASFALGQQYHSFGRKCKDRLVFILRFKCTLLWRPERYHIDNGVDCSLVVSR